MIESIAFIAYAVRDIAASRRFYEDILGLKLAWSSHDEWFEYDLGDTTFAITSTHIEHFPPVRGHWLDSRSATLTERCPDCGVSESRSNGKR